MINKGAERHRPRTGREHTSGAILRSVVDFESVPLPSRRDVDEVESKGMADQRVEVEEIYVTS